MNIMPSIIETVGRSKKAWDIPTKLYNDSSIITLFGVIDEELSYTIITQLLYLDSVDTDEPVKLYIQSPGGSVYAGNAIHDCIRNMRRKVDTIGMGLIASMGSFLLCAGTGKRLALPNTRIMIHGASGGAQGTIPDMEISLKEAKVLENRLVDLQVEYSHGKVTKRKLKQLTQRDKYLSVQESIDIGLIDGEV